jgi:hypothetical protein
MRKTFWGVNKNTFLTGEIDLPENISNLIMPLPPDDRDRVAGINKLTIKKLLLISISPQALLY